MKKILALGKTYFCHREGLVHDFVFVADEIAKIFNETPLSMRGFLKWDTQKFCWDGYLYVELPSKDSPVRKIVKEKISKKASCFPLYFLHRGLLFSTLGKVGIRGKKKRSDFSKDVQNFELLWSFSDGGFLRTKRPSLCKKNVVLQGNCSLAPGKARFSWELEKGAFFTEKFEKYSLWKKRSLPFSSPSVQNSLFQIGGSDFGSSTSFGSFLLSSDIGTILNLFPLPEWRHIISQGIGYFKKISQPFTLTAGGGGTIFSFSLPGFLFSFSGTGGVGCSQVKAFWKKFRFFCKPTGLISTESFCGGYSSFPVSLFAVSSSDITTIGFLLKDSLTKCPKEKSAYEIFFREKSSSMWAILYMEKISVWIKEFFMENNIVNRLPFHMLGRIRLAKKIAAFPGDVGILFEDWNKGEFVVSADCLR